ncbi:MAG: hypothetical protein VB137_05265 [Burkholderia sp.]
MPFQPGNDQVEVPRWTPGEALAVAAASVVRGGCRQFLVAEQRAHGRYLARIGGAGVCWKIVLSSCGFRVCIVCIRGSRSGSGSGIVGRARSHAGGRLASIGQGRAEQVELSGLERQRVILRRGSGGIAPRGCLHPHAWPFA